MINSIILLVSLAGLIKGADFLVDGASSLAKKFGIPPLVIGLTVVAFGTSMPEFTINVFSAFNGQAGISFGNVIGSNIANILLILGITAYLNPFKVKYSTIWKEIPFMIMVTFLLFVLVNDMLLDNMPNLLSRTDGIALLVLFVIFIYYTFGIIKVEGSKPDIHEMSLLNSLGLILLGMGLLGVGGHFVIESAMVIMKSLNISGEIIGLTMLAIGTSLPELATGINALKKNKPDILIGNVIGSNVFNLLFILGVTSFIKPLTYNSALNFDLIFVLISSCLLFLILFTGKKECSIERWEAAVLLLGYGLYLVSIIYRAGFI